MNTINPGQERVAGLKTINPGEERVTRLNMPLTRRGESCRVEYHNLSHEKVARLNNITRHSRVPGLNIML